MSSTDRFAHDDAAYVLGALGPAERRAFEEHLSGCAECTRRVSDIAGLPGLLGRLDDSAFVTPQDPPPVPDTLLPGLLREVRGRRRRGLLVVAAAVAAVAAVAVVAAVLGWRVLAPGSDPAPAPSVAAAPVATRTMAPVDQQRVTATVSLQQVAWGTRLRVACTYTGGGWAEEGTTPSYALVVRTRDGSRQQVSTWRAVPGRTTVLDAGTDATPADITAIDVVVTGTDRTLLTWTAG